MKIEVKNSLEVVKEAFWIAWQACGGPLGMGVLQDRPNATKEDVWDGVVMRLDYVKVEAPKGLNSSGDLRADYVFGRMMKLSIKWDVDSVTVNDGTPNIEYQAWCKKYPTYRVLIEAAIKNVSG